MSGVRIPQHVASNVAVTSGGAAACPVRASVNDDGRAEQITVCDLIPRVSSQHDHFTTRHVRKVRKTMLVLGARVVKAGDVVSTAVCPTRRAAAAII